MTQRDLGPPCAVPRPSVMCSLAHLHADVIHEGGLGSHRRGGDAPDSPQFLGDLRPSPAAGEGRRSDSLMTWLPSAASAAAASSARIAAKNSLSEAATACIGEVTPQAKATTLPPRLLWAAGRVYMTGDRPGKPAQQPEEAVCVN